MSNTTYLLLKPFHIPTDKGPRWAIAFSSHSGVFITAALTLVLERVLRLIWELLCFIPPFFDRNRRGGLERASIPEDPWSAFKHLAKTLHPNYRGSRPETKLCTSLLAFLLALLFFAGEVALGILGAGPVPIGGFAPVRPDAIYYPSSSGVRESPQLNTEWVVTRIPSVLRALSAADTGGINPDKDRVLVAEDPSLGRWNNGDEELRTLRYNYSVSGTDLGLQHGSNLELRVTGGCVTEYSWTVESQDTCASNGSDVYLLWPDSQGGIQVSVPIDPISTESSPTAMFYSHPEVVDQINQSGNASFAIVPFSACRSSFSAGSDPWYRTDPVNDWHVVRRRRPVLSCWQQDKWSYGSVTVNSILDLDDIPGIEIARVLLQVIQDGFGLPMVCSVGMFAGSQALKSSSSSTLVGLMNAAQSAARTDMERLVKAAYVASRDFFLDATLNQPSPGLTDMLHNGTELVKGAADFIIQTPDAQAFSMRGLISVCTVFIALFFIRYAIIPAIQFFVLHKHEPLETYEIHVVPKSG